MDIVNRQGKNETRRQVATIAYGNGRPAKMGGCVGRLNLRAWTEPAREDGCEVIIRGDTADIYVVAETRPERSRVKPEVLIAKRVRERQLIEEMQKM